MLYYYQEKSPEGGYTNREGERINLIYGSKIWLPGKAPNEGCTLFPSLEACLAAWGLSPMEAVPLSPDFVS